MNTTCGSGLREGQSDLGSHPTAVQAADSDPGPALPALTVHFLQSGLMTLSLGRASASGLGCSSLSQETSTPFLVLLEWPGRLNPRGPALILTEGCGATRSSTSWVCNRIYCMQIVSCSCSLGFCIFTEKSTLLCWKQDASYHVVFQWTSVAEINHRGDEIAAKCLFSLEISVVPCWADVKLILVMHLEMENHI